MKCPKCHGAGVVTADEDNAYFRCLSCGHQETRDRTIYHYDVHNQCKNCGRYFAVMRHGATEYCGRVADERGRTCREVGAINTWTRSKRDDEVFKVYRREYKKRFAWIKAGRITDQQFYDWSERARAEKDKCEQGLISQKDLEVWLKESK